MKILKCSQGVETLFKLHFTCQFAATPPGDFMLAASNMCAAGDGPSALRATKTFNHQRQGRTGDNEPW